MLLAAAQQSGLISQLVKAVPGPAQGSRLAKRRAPCRQQLLLTLFFLGAVGLARPWDLRHYSGDGLALLTGRRWAYGYVHTDRFLGELARSQADQRLSAAVAQWSYQLWGHQAPYYIDMHRKPVYSDQPLPRGLIGRTGKVLGSRALALLHDGQGHPLFATTARGDSHLTQQLPGLVSHYHQALDQQPIRQIVVDREGLGADFLAGLKDTYQIMTLLRSNQYTDLTSFTDVGDFVPLYADQAGQVVCEVAPARFSLTLTEPPGQHLPLYVALIRDWRRQVPVVPTETEVLAQNPLAALDGWWEEDWQPVPCPARLTTPKLIPVVSTAPIADVLACVKTYKRRWPLQENIIRDFLLPLGLDHNHGYTKTAVVNSEIAKRRAGLKQHLDHVLRWRKKACHQHDLACRRYQRRYQQTRAWGEALYDELNLEQGELEKFDLPTDLVRRHLKAKRALIEAELAPHWQQVYQADRQSQQVWTKIKRYVRQAGQLLRQLADLEAHERQMFELDNHKDQVMTTLRLALANLVMWVRDHFFPTDYAQATWKRLESFFRLPGHIVDYPERCVVYLRPFNDRHLNRDLDDLCERVNQAQPCLPDGRYLQFLRYKSLTLISNVST